MWKRFDGCNAQRRRLIFLLKRPFLFSTVIIFGIEKHTVSNRWAFLSNVFLSFSSGKCRTNNAKTKQHYNIYACAKDRETHKKMLTWEKGDS